MGDRRRTRRVVWIVGSVVALLVVAGLVIEVGGRLGAERLAERRIRDEVAAQQVDVVVGRSWWRPTMIPALLTGDLDRIAVTLRDANVAAFPVGELDYVLEDLSADISLRDQSIRVTSLGRGTVEMFVDPAAIGAALGVRAIVEDDQLLVGPDREVATLRVVGEDLVVSSATFGGDAAQTIRVGDSTVMPCTPEVVLDGDQIRLWCQGSDLPGLLGGTFGTAGPDISGVPAPTELEPPATLELDGSGTPIAPTTTAPTTTTGAPDDSGG